MEGGGGGPPLDASGGRSGRGRGAGDLSPGGDGSGQLQGLLHGHAQHVLLPQPQQQSLHARHSSPPLPHHVQQQHQQQLQHQQHPSLRHHHSLASHHLPPMGGHYGSLHETSSTIGVHHSESDHLDVRRIRDPLTSSGPVQLHEGLTDSHQASLLRHHSSSLDAQSVLYSLPPGLGHSGGGYSTMTQPYGGHHSLHHHHHQQQQQLLHHHQHQQHHHQRHSSLPPMVSPVMPSVGEEEEEPDTPTSAGGGRDSGSVGDEGEEVGESVGRDGTRFVSLREREEIARWAYRTWFRVKPGHKEVKDKWWALYYRKLLPQYHLRDNYLGRKINQWIEEDLEPLKAAHPEQFAQKAQGRPGRKPKIRIHPDGTPMKRRKPNSSKEGTMPAYANVEMIQPTLSEAAGMEVPPFVQKLAACCVDGNVDWNAEQLDADMAWFKKNRIQIMENIPSLTKGSKRKKEQGGPAAAQKRPRAADPPKYTHTFPDGLELYCDIPWIKTDLHKTEHAYIIRIDMPGVAPETDLIVQTDGNKLVIKGERKNQHPLSSEDESVLENLLVQRPVGPFSLEVVLPPNADIAHTEQTYSHGVLTIKVPLKAPQWRTLNILHLSPGPSNLVD